LLADLILISGDAELAANALEHIRPMAESGQFHSRYFQTLENRVSALAESSLSSASTELGSHSADTWREVIRSIAELNPTARSIGRVSGRDEWSRDLIVAWMREPAHASALNEIMPVISQALDDTIDAPNAHDVLSTVDSAGFARLMEFTPSLAARAVSIIQHAGETEQQAAVLDWIEPHALAGTFDGQAYALLFDRVAKAQGRPQRYGTQDACAADGSRIPYMLEDATRVDEWREQMDLMPLDDYFRVHNENMGPCQ
jgi:chemotaxis protein CheY-P-specific phosphatase CheC